MWPLLACKMGKAHFNTLDIKQRIILRTSVGLQQGQQGSRQLHFLIIVSIFLVSALYM